MVQLAEWQERFDALGVAVAAMSYDAPELLASFAADNGLRYPLLSDQDARHVKAYGVLNPEYQPGHRAYGIPLPGVLFVDPTGRIVDKFAVPDYRERPEFADIHQVLEALLAEQSSGAPSGPPANAGPTPPSDG